MNVSRQYGDRRGGQWRIVAWGGVLALLASVSALQMATGQPDWTVGDYALAAGLLGMPLIVYEFVIRQSGLRPYRIAAGLALGATVLLVWINGAVGIIGSEDNPANLMYFGVLLIAAGGAFAGRFRAEGLVRAMQATAIGQAGVMLIAVTGGLGLPETGPVALIIINGFFIALWWAAATLFGIAAKTEEATR